MILLLGCLLAFLIQADPSSVKVQKLHFTNETWESGYIPVRGPGNELFYFFFKSRDKNPNAPLLVWLNGGPGSSSCVGMLEENGPYLVHSKNLNYFYNNYSWNSFADAIFLDQPVGTGMSTTASSSDHCTNVTCVARDVHNFLLRFTDKHPEYKKRPLYITGESYAGHYIPAIAGHLTRIGSKDIINLQGVAIGNPYTDIGVQLPAYPFYLLEHNLFSYWQYIIAKVLTFSCVVGQAFRIDYRILTLFCSYSIWGMVRIPNYYDIRETKSYDAMDKIVVEMLRDKKNLEYINSKKANFSLGNRTIFYAFARDFQVSLSYEIEYVLDAGLEVIIYFGDKDYICNWRGGELLLKSLKWSGSTEFNKLAYKDWVVGNSKPGYYKKYKNLNFFMLKDAGHLAPTNQPEYSLLMLKAFIEKKF